MDTIQEQAAERIVTPGQLVMKRFRRNKLALVGIAILVIMFLFSFVGPFLSPYGEYEMFYKEINISNIYLYAGNRDIIALNIADGAFRWRLTLPGAMTESPRIARDGTLYIPLEDGSILQVNASDGKVLETHSGTTTEALVPDPFVPEQKFPADLDVVMEDGTLVATNRESGFKKWDFMGYAPLVTDLFADETGVLYVVDAEGQLYAVRTERGVQKWSYESELEGPYEVTEGHVVVRTLKNRELPNAEHWLGTDRMGLDVLTRLMYGGRISLMVGFVVILIELLLGVLMGGLAGYYGRWVDNLLMRLVDIFNCIPTLPVLLIISSIMMATGIPPQYRIYFLMLVMGLLGWPGIARIVRGQILSLREQEFMVATEATGLRPMRRIYKHLVPNVMPQLIVIATLGIGGVILTESALSYLGLGLSFPYASWGNMVDAVNDRKILQDFLNIWVPPGLCILLTVMSFNFVGDGLRDAFDPKMRR